MASRWPKDNQAALIRFYGDPGSGDVAEQLVKIAPPFKMYYDGRLLNTISFHKKAAPALLAALGKVWDYYGHDQAVIDKLGISKTAGTYNPRKIRGSATKWSNHAYGAAIDINAEQNGFNVVGNIPLPMIAAFKSEGFRWGGDYKGRKDPMHFEACDSGEPERSFDGWLKALGVKQKPKIASTAASPVVAAPRKPATDVPDHVQEDFALDKPKAPATPAPAAEGVQGDPELWNVQRRLKDMKYNPGGLDGIWGGLSAGAITGFINDRKLDLSPPTSIENFHSVQEQLKIEIGKAEAERFTRPIMPERSEATSDQLAPKLPEVGAAKRASFWSKIQGWWSALFGGASAGAVATNLIPAKEAVEPVKSWFGETVPYALGAAFVVAIIVIAVVLAKKATGAANESADASTEAFRSGERA